MNTIRFFAALPTLALATALTLSSCSKDKEGIDNTPAPEGYGYFSVALNTESASQTRANMTEAGTIEESFVNKALVVLYNNNEVVYQFSYNFSNVNSNDSALQNFTGNGLAATQPTTGADKKVITGAQPVADLDYKMLVILNPTDAMRTATKVGDNLTAFTTAKTTVGAADFLGTNRLTMTNADGLVDVELCDYALAAEQNPTPVSVDRVVAKITTVKGTDFDTNIQNNKDEGRYVAISDISWYVENLNTSTYWMRKPTDGKDGLAESSLNGDRSKYYAEDPNMTTGGVSFTPVLDLSTGIASQKNPLGSLTEAKTEYVIENTFGTGVDPVGNGTLVIVKCKIQPLLYNVNESYYSIDGLYFTHTEAMNFRYGVSSAPANAPSTFGGAVATCAFFKEGATEPDNYAEDASGIVFHYQGWNVYRIPIKHFGGTNPATDRGYYGVVRNNAYQVKIQDITGPGGPAVYDKFIAADIAINPWVIRGQDENLGN